MHKFRQAVLVASATALVLTAFAAPAAAGPGKATIGIVNGIPNTRVDICVNGKELRSAAKYGQAVAKVVQAGSKIGQDLPEGPADLPGRGLAKKTMNLPAGSDFTLVFTKKAPKWVKFNNAGLGQIWPNGVAATTAHMAWRHAADLGTVSARYSFGLPAPAPSAVEQPWTKGQQIPLASVPPWAPGGASYALSFARLDKPGDLARSKPVYAKAGVRYEFYLLGTWAGNAKVIIWKRQVTAPSL